ncbi:putative Restriction endonuclease [uncultured Thiomicrorhabdus sp.]
MLKTNCLPPDWIAKVEEFDTSGYGANRQKIADLLKGHIAHNPEQALQSSMIQIFVESVVCGKEFLVAQYDCLPSDLIDEFAREIGGAKGFKFTEKAHSFFVELLTAKFFIENGYQVLSAIREQGDCDLKLLKDDVEYHFEVKFKESPDTKVTRIMDYVNGKILFGSADYIKGKKAKVTVINSSINYDALREILEEFDRGIAGSQLQLSSEYINVEFMDDFGSHTAKSRDINVVSQELASLFIVNYTEQDLVLLICDLFINNNGHLTKLINKHERCLNEGCAEKFSGVLVWSLPFNMDADVKDIENAFKTVCQFKGVKFDLHVFLTGYQLDKEVYFCVMKSEEMLHLV